MIFVGDTTAADLSAIRKVASVANLPTEFSRSSTEGQGNHVEKFAVLIHHADQYIVNAESQLVGEALNNIQQLATLGYIVISINPSKWQGMALSSKEEKVIYLNQQFRLNNCDIFTNQSSNAS